MKIVLILLIGALRDDFRDAFRDDLDGELVLKPSRVPRLETQSVNWLTVRSHTDLGIIVIWLSCVSTAIKEAI